MFHFSNLLPIFTVGKPTLSHHHHSRATLEIFWTSTQMRRFIYRARRCEAWNKVRRKEKWENSFDDFLMRKSSQKSHRPLSGRRKPLESVETCWCVAENWIQSHLMKLRSRQTMSSLASVLFTVKVQARERATIKKGELNSTGLVGRLMATFLECCANK